jgi:hypothetical protein
VVNVAAHGEIGSSIVVFQRLTRALLDFLTHGVLTRTRDVWRGTCGEGRVARDMWRGTCGEGHVARDMWRGTCGEGRVASVGPDLSVRWHGALPGAVPWLDQPAVSVIVLAWYSLLISR